MTTKIYYKPITEGNGENHNDVKILKNTAKISMK